jgi:plasmid stabilization system protein ParE
MALAIVYHPLVREELREIYWWYAERSPKTADNFLVVFHAAVELLAEFPKVNQLYRDDIRRASLKPFPYHLYYWENAGRLTLLSIRHVKRKRDERLESRRSDLQ